MEPSTSFTTPAIVPPTKLARRPPIWISAGCGFALGVLVLSQIQNHTRKPPQPAAESTLAATTQNEDTRSSTNIYAHNLRLHQGPDFRVYIQWLRGQLKSARPGIVPSFDDPESFYLNVTNGVIRANMGDICNYLNSKSAHAPLTDIQITGVGNQVKITGKLHKVITLPVEVLGLLKPAPNNRVEIEVSKISVLKIPVKAMLGGLHLTLSSLLSSEEVPGLEVQGNNLFFDSNLLLPPPHIKGTLTSVSLMSPDLEAVYGDVTKDVARVGEWRNFMQLRGGTLNFGKLTMQQADLMLIDISQDAWFDLDLIHYQDQLVNGYSRMTPEKGLQIFMPDVSELNTNHISHINIEWFKNRNVAPPASVVPNKP